MSTDLVSVAGPADTAGRLVPGEVLLAGSPVVIGPDAEVELVVANTGDRPVQVGSHFHFAESNPALSFDRAQAHGMRLAIPAGTSVRFEPGIERRVGLVPLGGRRRVLGLRGEVAGDLDSGQPPGVSTGAGPGSQERGSGR